jgi:serine/threonine-protein kinase HipA
MDTVLKVTLWGEEVAAIVWDRQRETAVLEFFDSFTRTGLNIAPLTMPLEDLRRGERIFSFPALSFKTYQGLPGLIADSLPDDYGNSVIDEWFSRRGYPMQITPVDRLMYIGKRGMGALEYEPVMDEPLLNESSQIEMAGLTAMAASILNEREIFQAKLSENKKALIDVLKVGTSAGGAKPKAIIAYNETTKELRSGQVKAPPGFTYWLLKFDGLEGGKIKDNPAGIGRIEYAFHKMALDCGILMTECRLWHEGQQAHFMTKRFDRNEAGEKMHIQTLCGLAHFDRDKRYSYEQLFQVMRQLYLSHSEMEQMYRRMVFNIVARNHDDHTKNHAFMMDKQGQWSLAPAYDVCYSYSPSGTWTRYHQLSLNGKRELYTYDDLIAVAPHADIRYPGEIIAQVLQTVSQWERYARAVEVPEAYMHQISENLILF